MSWIFRIVGLLIVAISFIYITIPYKTFLWHEGWKPHAWRSKNLKLSQIMVFAWVIRIGGIVGLIFGIWMIFFLSP